MASHKVTSQSAGQAPQSVRSHPTLNKHSSVEHTPQYSFSDQQVSSTFPRKGSLPHIKTVGGDKVGYVSPSFSQDIPQTPSSPGKLVQKYMEHMEVHPSSSHSRKHHVTLSQDQLPVQDAMSVHSVKATALVAPYVGDRSQSNPHFETENVYYRGKPKAVLVSRSEPSQVSGHSSDKWKTLVETKDHLLAQKNHLIERQKLTISHLQAQLQDIEAKNSLHSSAGDTSLQARLKELEYKNVALQAELAQVQSGQRRETEQLSNKLDSAEYELHKKTVDFSRRLEELQTENSDLQKQVTKLTATVKELEQKLQLTGTKNKELSEHIVKLNGYFENMPTMEEYHALKEHADHLDKLCKSLTAQLSDRDQQLKMSTSKLEEQEVSFTQLQTTCDDLRQQLANARAEATDEHVQKVGEENRRVVHECHRLQKLVFDADKKCQHELEAMRQRHKNRFLEATADLRARHKTVVKRVKILEAQLLRNSDAMMAVNEELQLNQGTVSELKSSVKDLLVQNQQLVEKNISLQEATETAAANDSPTSAKTQQLAVEMTQCVRDFKSLVDLSSSLMEGKCSSSLLLGKGEGEEAGALASETDLMFSDHPDNQLEQVRRLRQEVATLRELVSEQLAIQVSSACHIQ